MIETASNSTVHSGDLNKNPHSLFRLLHKSIQIFTLSVYSSAGQVSSCCIAEFTSLAFKQVMGGHNFFLFLLEAEFIAPGMHSNTLDHRQK